MLNARKFRHGLLSWYDRHKRDLPWRSAGDPYRIWISEIMLQQTRVAAVIPFYDRFLGRFPTVAALAVAPEQDLLAAWAGLGYYSRARNLQSAARQIQSRGAFPEDYAGWRELAGVGDYTASAVSSIAFGRPHAALDGNVLRVLSRVVAEAGDIRSPSTRARLLELDQSLLDRKRPGDFNQGMMELGATICLPKQPQCASCPVSEFCESRLRGTQADFPIRLKRAASEEVRQKLLIVAREAGILMRQRPRDSRRMPGFWELPEAEHAPGAAVVKRLGEFRHSIVNVTYRIQVFEATLARAPRGYRWVATSSLKELPLSTTARKALRCWDNETIHPH